MPAHEAPCVELGSAPRTPSVGPSPSPSVSGASSPEPQNIRPTPLFRALAMPPPEPEQPPGQEELERRIPGYRRIVIPRELTLIELLKQSSGASTDEEVLQIREAKLRVISDRIGLRRLHVLSPYLRSLILDGSAISSLRDLGVGLVHLKILSVNRCGLTSLDGIWGLNKLREFYATNNKLQDVSALAALQKLHTLNLAYNPIADSSRLWMLAVCESLRKLTLEGTPAADEPNYRSEVALALPLLTHLDDRPLHNDIEDDIEGIFEDPALSSESEEETELLPKEKKPLVVPEQGPSTSKDNEDVDRTEETDEIEDLEAEVYKSSNQLKLHERRRPATTECAGTRPCQKLPSRPKTAHDRPQIEATTRLQIMNMLMDDEWRCSGSKLTSRGPVCGNLAQALRRPATARRSRDKAAQDALISSSIDLVSREIAQEIPHAPKLDEWARFKAETGIDIDIDFSKRLDSGDALTAIERLEQIERETKERLGNPDNYHEDLDIKDRDGFFSVNYELWKMENLPLMDEASPVMHTPRHDLVEIDELLRNIDLVRTPENSPPD